MQGHHINKALHTEDKHGEDTAACCIQLVINLQQLPWISNPVSVNTMLKKKKSELKLKVQFDLRSFCLLCSCAVVKLQYIDSA